MKKAAKRLKQITAEAKKIRKAAGMGKDGKPKMKWQTALKRAGKAYTGK